MTASEASRLIENIADEVLMSMEYGEGLEATKRIAANFAKRVTEVESWVEPPAAEGERWPNDRGYHALAGYATVPRHDIGGEG